MSQVWEAGDELLDTEVTVKEVRQEEGLSEDDHERAIARAMAEARNAAVLRDVVVDDGGPWTVMRLVRGRSPAQVLRADGPLEQERAAEVAADTAPVAVVAGKFLRVYSITADNRLQEVSLETGKPWNLFTLADASPSARTPTAVVHDGVTSVFTANSTDGHPSEARLTPPRQTTSGAENARWSLHDLTKDFRVPAPRSAPAALVHGGTTGLFTTDGNGRLTETKAAGEDWAPSDSPTNASLQQTAADSEPAVVDQGSVTRIYTVRRSDGKPQETALRKGTWSTEAVAEG